jgi:hypothetical protein
MLYLLAGAGVAAAVYLTATTERWERCFQVASAVAFWPLYVPTLLSRPVPLPPSPVTTDDDLARRIADADAELDAALESLAGWADDLRARQHDRLQEMRATWSIQAERIRAMDRLLCRHDHDEAITTGDVILPASQRLRGSQEMVRQNLEALRQIHERTRQDLLETLAGARELASTLQLARFSGATPEQAEELFAHFPSSREAG